MKWPSFPCFLYRNNRAGCRISEARGGEEGGGRGCSFWIILSKKTSEILYFHKNPHENEIILAKGEGGGVQATLWIFPWTVLHQDPQVRVPRPHQGCESSDTVLSRGQK